MISPHGKPQTTIFATAGPVIIVLCLLVTWWWAAIAVALITIAALAFFRDPDRVTPMMRGQVVAPADGRISSIHRVDHFEPFDGPAQCVRIFLSVLDVHVNRSPMHGRVASKTHRPGEYLNALKAESAEKNEALTIVLNHPTKPVPIGAVRQVAGAIARRIVCAVEEGEIMQRGQRFGLIKFGSTTELYLPYPDKCDVQVRQGQYVYGGVTVLAMAPNVLDMPTPAPGGESNADQPVAQVETVAVESQSAPSETA